MSLLCIHTCIGTVTSLHQSHDSSFFCSYFRMTLEIFWHVSFVGQSCDIFSGMRCTLLSFTIAILKRGRPVDMNVIPNFPKKLGNPIRLR